MLKIYIDASTKGNPGPSGLGIVFVSNHLHHQVALPAPIMSNHEAEFLALETALEYAIEQNWHQETTYIYSDSKVVVETMDKQYTHNPLFKPYLKRIEMLFEDFPLLFLQWIPESKNKGADNLARQGLAQTLRQMKLS
ncbi:ribonuclease HI family protein [Vagococcus xieshaowenii]|uniref:Ribonuclease HI family protein n=1 Tax=Vagococcus xieshaowenii TaxID=2562451 RepID=A0A4Z0D6W0_9ENTE|nr:ribonuclease HI family protein [Vagococcus xieshaowenii]QCA28581.1 ribonuclease HI family protein [Vagococcus xieshaowenii]TFZ40611.1 ribonuclease HI family protein [Vagococcus xieshaowenii]